MKKFLLCLFLAGCASPKGLWHAEGMDWDVQPWVDATIKVTGDKRGHLRAGGTVRVVTDAAAMLGRCVVPAGRIPTGCADPGLIDVLYWPERGLGPSPGATALPHELCHLGLVRLNFWRSPVYPTEDQVDACALLVRVEAP